MIYIYQIGRLEKNITNEINFRIGGEIISSSLSSLALKQHLENSGKGNVKVILAYPVSLPFNGKLIEGESQIPTDLKNKIKRILDDSSERENYLKNPEEFFKSHPHSNGNEFFIIHSIGQYERQKFEGKYDDIVLDFFIDMLERIKVCDQTEIYVDVSSGLNVYVSAMLEAVRHFSTYYHLSEWENRKLKVFLVFTDPIIGSSANEFNIYKDYELKFKVFFSSPIKKEDIDNFALARKIAGEDRKLKKCIQEILENFAICFSAIKNNAPLAVYTFGYDKICEVKELEEKILQIVKYKLRENWERSPNLEKDAYIKLFLTLGFYRGIIKVLEKQSICPSREVNMRQMKEKFKKIYETFNLTLNEKFLGNEVSNLARKLKDKDIKEWTLLKCALEMSGEMDERNFFAHSGLESNLTEVKKNNDEILIRYKEEEEKLKKVKEWLKKNL